MTARLYVDIMKNRLSCRGIQSYPERMLYDRLDTTIPDISRLRFSEDKNIVEHLPESARKKWNLVSDRQDLVGRRIYSVIGRFMRELSYDDLVF